MAHFSSGVDTSQSDFDEQVRRDRLHDVPPGAIAVINSVQPFIKDPTAAAHSPLAMLSSLDNADKHRSLTTSSMGPVIEKNNWGPEASRARLEHPAHLFTEAGAEIGRFIFISPQREEDTKVEFLWRFVLMQGPMWSLIDISAVIRSYDWSCHGLMDT